MPVGSPTLGAVPVGGAVAWMLSLTGTPSLPDEFVQCNGQTLSDPESVYNGTVIPALNGTTDSNRMFLRGSTTSGGTGGTATHTHTVTSTTTSIAYQTGSTNFSPQAPASPTGSASTIPTCYNVTYVMRIK
jgi:hypothetical protein